MFLKKTYENNRIRNGLFCLFASAIVVWFVLFTTSKYSFTLIQEKFSGEKLQVFYADLNADIYTERLELHKYTEGKSGLLIKTKEQTIEQWNFDGEFAPVLEPMIGDYDQDRRHEIILFSRKGDSLYMHGIDAFAKETEFRDVPVCRLFEVNGNFHYTIEPVDFYDTDQDGKKEILFALETGFARRPRTVFAYFPALDSIATSPESNAVIKSFVKSDLDRDSVPEYFGTSQASGNWDLNSTYSDMYSWLMVFQPDLKYKFPPVKTGTYPSITRVSPFRVKGESYILVMHDYGGSEGELDYLALYDAGGNMIRKQECPDPGLSSSSLLIPPSGTMKAPVVISESGTLFTIEEDLTLHAKKQLKNIRISSPYFLDIDRDGECEIIFYEEEWKGLVVYRNSFKEPATLELKDIPAHPFFTVVNNNRFSNALSVRTAVKDLIFDYHRTLIHRYWYLFGICVFIAIYAAFMLVLKVREFREIKRSRSRIQLAELQMHSIQNQLDPHFTFNILQSFASLLNEDDREKANYLFDKYADLLKTTVLNSDKVLIPLEEELNFIDSYISLEEFRQQDRFIHRIEIGEKVDLKILIPKMLLHIFVENAVKHGLRHRQATGGELLITGTRDNGFLKISIRDNGIGREASAKLDRFSTGKGLGILDQILELYKLLHRRRIIYYINDLNQDKNPVGTKVDIYIPQ